MRWLFLILFGVMMSSVNAQYSYDSNTTEYESKYQINTLEEMDIEKLQSDKKRYYSNRNNGIVITATGLIISVLGFTKSAEGSDLNSSALMAFVGGLGANLFIGGVVIWIVNGHKHHKIKNALQSLDFKSGSLNFNNRTDKIYQLGITINF